MKIPGQLSAKINTQSFSTSGASEYATQGLSDFALNYMRSTASSVRTELGLRAEESFIVSAPTIVPSDALFVTSGRLAWAHEYTPSRTGRGAFEVASLTPFSVTGAEPASNSALVTAGAELRLANGITVFAKADADLALTAYTVRGNVGLNYIW